MRVGPRSAPVGSASEAAYRLAADLARALGKTPPPMRSRKPRALDSYLEGKRLLEGWDVERNYTKAEEAFRAALAAEPEFSEARASLALALWHRFQETREPAAIEQAEPGGPPGRGPEPGPSRGSPGPGHGPGPARPIHGGRACPSRRRTSSRRPTTRPVGTIGRAYARLKRYREAETFYERALAAASQLLGEPQRDGLVLPAAGNECAAPGTSSPR